MGIPAAVWQDSDYSPPIDGGTNLVTLVAATASAATDTGVTGATVLLGPQFITFSCTADWSLVMSKDGSSTITTPVVATATCFPYLANTPVSLRITPTNRYFKAISTGGGALKWYLSSGPGQ